jgi:hypothetical protein
MIRLKKSTGSQELILGTLVDAADGYTPETALTIANTDIKIWKNGATTAVNKNSGAARRTSRTGCTYCVLDATDTDTVGPLVVMIPNSGGAAGARPIGRAVRSARSGDVRLALRHDGDVGKPSWR